MLTISRYGRVWCLPCLLTRLGALAHGCLCSFVQVVEDRFRVWLDNLQFIEDYNTKHTSHWVSW
jgi:hypothetical protein